MADPRQTVEQAFQRLNDHDMDGYYDLCADDMIYVRAGETTHGKEQVRALDEQLLAILPDHWRRIEHLLVDGDVAAAWIVLGGTLAADGEPFETEVCDIFEVRNDLIQRVTVYADRSELLRRLQA